MYKMIISPRMIAYLSTETFKNPHAQRSPTEMAKKITKEELDNWGTQKPQKEDENNPTKLNLVYYSYNIIPYEYSKQPYNPSQVLKEMIKRYKTYEQ